VIRSATTADAEAICGIYNHYIDNTSISFEYEAVSIETMQQRIQNTLSEYTWLVYEAHGEILGYAYANLWKARKAYQHVLEVTVYTSHTNTVKGVGTKVYQALFDELKNYPADKQVKALMAVVALPNEASVGIHKKLGFYEAGYFKQVGKKFDQWIDVAYYQKDLF